MSYSVILVVVVLSLVRLLMTEERHINRCLKPNTETALNTTTTKRKKTSFFLFNPLSLWPEKFGLLYKFVVLVVGLLVVSGC